jgi:DNA-binding Xre family transcriptional regulator
MTEKEKQQIENLEEQTNILFKIGNKLEQRIATLEKVIGKLQLKVGDVVLYIDKKAENNDNN